ncbi:hypothetical protein ACIBL3_41465 [Kribbella sp. NPDC050124]
MTAAYEGERGTYFAERASGSIYNAHTQTTPFFLTVRVLRR